MSQSECDDLRRCQHIVDHYSAQVKAILDGRTGYITISLTILAQELPGLYLLLVEHANTELAEWDKALLAAQRNHTNAEETIKPDCSVRFCDMPTVAQVETDQQSQVQVGYPRVKQAGRLTMVCGTVVRIQQKPKFVERQVTYKCDSCNQEFDIVLLYNNNYEIAMPTKCPYNKKPKCAKSSPKRLNSDPNPDYTFAYRELILQDLSGLGIGSTSLLVTLEDDLVECCKLGDRVQIIGTVCLRGSSKIEGRRNEMNIVLKANNVFTCATPIDPGQNIAQLVGQVKAEWDQTAEELGSELAARDLLVQSICPAISGLSITKLAIALCLASNNDRNLRNADSVRHQSHLLLVSDPGFAKSQLLHFAKKLVDRAIFTTGTGSTTAGLTAAAMKGEDNSFHLEAGALVLSDGGLCCIDELAKMHENDKVALHEAMEQQEVSISKAGTTCKVPTRCTILAACNPETPLADGSGKQVDVKLNLTSTLLSRFDLILVLRERDRKTRDTDLCRHILATRVKNTVRAKFVPEKPDVCWNVPSLMRHFEVTKQISPTISKEAGLVISNYYTHCRADNNKENSRTTHRMLDSIERLTKAHARLMLRNIANEIDAFMAVMLIDSSYGMGKSKFDLDLVGNQFALGPTQEQINKFWTTRMKNCLSPLVLPYDMQKVALYRQKRTAHSNEMNFAQSSTNRNDNQEISHPPYKKPRLETKEDNGKKNKDNDPQQIARSITEIEILNTTNLLMNHYDDSWSDDATDIEARVPAVTTSSATRHHTNEAEHLSLESIQLDSDDEQQRVQLSATPKKPRLETKEDNGKKNKDNDPQQIARSITEIEILNTTNLLMNHYDDSWSDDATDIEARVPAVTTSSATRHHTNEAEHLSLESIQLDSDDEQQRVQLSATQLEIANITKLFEGSDEENWSDETTREKLPVTSPALDTQQQADEAARYLVACESDDWPSTNLNSSVPKSPTKRSTSLATQLQADELARALMDDIEASNGCVPIRYMTSRDELDPDWQNWLSEQKD